jgi:hypothetical protein
VEPFVAKHAEHGTLSRFDRLVFRGTLRILAHRHGLMSYLSHIVALLKKFGGHARLLTEQLNDAATSLPRRMARPGAVPASAATNKEEIARKLTECRSAQARPDLRPDRTRAMPDP